MKDLGFGLIDKRTTVIFLIGIVLSTVVLGNQIPVDTTTASGLFTGLMLLTGYVYISRTLLRLPLAIFVAFLMSPKMAAELLPEKFYEVIVNILHKDEHERESWSLAKKVFWEIKRLTVRIIWAIALTPFVILLLPFRIIAFDNWTNEFDTMIRLYYPAWLRFQVFQNKVVRAITLWFFGSIDRAGVFAIAILSTLPSTRKYVNILGVIGLTLMSVMYIFRGNFSGIAPDAIKEEKSPSANKTG